MVAARRRHLAAVELLLDVRCSVTLRNSKQMTALHEACLSGDLNICKRLLMAGSNVNARECEGDTPLLLAATRGYDEIVGLLTK